MSATDMIYKIIDEKCLKQSAVARAAGYDPKKFNALLRGRKRLTSDDVVPICKALGVTPNELFGIDHPGDADGVPVPPHPGEERMSRRKWSLLIGLIGSVVFNVGWWISYPPMVFAGVLLAAAGLDLWIGR